LFGYSKQKQKIRTPLNCKNAIAACRHFTYSVVSFIASCCFCAVAGVLQKGIAALCLPSTALDFCQGGGIYD
jgi:hypothetical protein